MNSGVVMLLSDAPQPNDRLRLVLSKFPLMLWWSQVPPLLCGVYNLDA